MRPLAWTRRQALEELMRDMTSGDPVVIAAGYPKEMRSFLSANAGLECKRQEPRTIPNNNTL